MLPPRGDGLSESRVARLTAITVTLYCPRGVRELGGMSLWATMGEPGFRLRQYKISA